MPNNEYWIDRMSKVESMANKKGMDYTNHVNKQFQIAQKNIEQKIEYWYAKIADNNEISMSAAKELLRRDELEDFHLSIEEYIENGKNLAYDNLCEKQLKNASAKVHIQRLEALKMQMQQECEVLFGGMADGLDDTLADIYGSTYYHTAYEYMKGCGVGWAFNRLDNRRIKKALETCWTNDNETFSSRVWKNKNKLINDLNTVLTQSIIRGESPQKAISLLSQKMKTSRYNAGRLIMTESSAIYSASQKDCYKELDVEKYEFVATLDSSTSEICRDMDGKVFDMSDYKVGLTAPPLHCFCRSVTVPYFPDEDGQRIARGEDGKNYYVPANMTYREWEKSFVDGDVDDLKQTVHDDTMDLKNKISETNDKIEDLENQFSGITEGYSHDEWFKDYDSIEDGFGGVTAENESDVNKLKDIDKKLKDATQQKSELLSQKEMRGQLETGYSGKIPDDKLDEYNAKAFEQIKLDTGYSDEEAKRFHNALKEYFGGDYGAILEGKTRTAMVISDGLDRMPTYDGAILRGMIFDNNVVKSFSELKQGDTLPRKGIIESWSSEKTTAIGYAGISDYEKSSVILECVDNKTGVGVQHISSFGKDESEVLCTSDYEVIEVVVENKYDFLSKHKEYLYSDSDLVDEELTMKGNVVCKIKVKEKR